MADTRLEQDSIGTRQVPADAYYGIASLRAAENFPISGTGLHRQMIRSLAAVKKACARANLQAGLLDARRAGAICTACDRIRDGQYQQAFIVDPMQGSAGTSMNMNANEVIANAAIVELGGVPGQYTLVHPNDHVNRCQSTNDVIPTAGKLTVLQLLEPLYQALEALQQAFSKKAEEFDGIVKMGRTQLQDAVPIRLGQEFGAYASAVGRNLQRLRQAARELLVINLGGTAIGTGITAGAAYSRSVTQLLAQETGFPFRQAEDLIDGTQHIDSFAAVSGALRVCGLALSKIANDLRLLSSGPRTGIGEISLPARQCGSSIMPGKINPVIPELVTQVAFLVAGNDVTVSMAVEAGQLELNAFEPVIFRCLFQSVDELTAAVRTFTEHCVRGITANEGRCRELLEASVGTVTALSPYIGYSRAAELARQSLKTGIPLGQLAESQGLLTPEQLKVLLDPAALTRLPGSRGGLSGTAEPVSVR